MCPTTMTPLAEMMGAYRRPDLDAARAEAAALAARCREATSGAACVDAVLAWTERRIQIETARQLARLRFLQDTRAPEARAEDAFWTEAEPAVRELEQAYAEAVAGTRWTDALAAHFGPQILRVARAGQHAHAPSAAEAIAAEARATSEYLAISSEPVSFQGRRATHGERAGLASSPDRGLRRAAAEARDAHLAERMERLDAVFEELVRRRTELARALGARSFTDVAYRKWARIGYGRAEVAALRDDVRVELVPVVAALRAACARRLGIERVLISDERAFFADEAPRPVGDLGELLGEALAPLGLREVWRTMRDGGLVDAASRPGKAGGGECFDFPAYPGTAAIFFSAGGVEADLRANLRALTHELGHAYETLASGPQPLLEYRRPTLDVVEVPSHGLEHLVYPHLAPILGEEGARRYRLGNLELSVSLLPEIAAMDEFQHVVHAQPDLTPAARRALWRELEARYLPFRDVSGLRHLEAGGMWQRLPHPFTMPLYMIDYVTGQLPALALWERSEQDPAAALAAWRRVCEAGGSASMPEILASAGLPTPFGPGTVARAARAVERALASAG